MVMALPLDEAIPIFGLLGVLVGMAAAALSLTSWAILLPMLMVTAEVDVYNALIICFIVDAVNGLFVAWRYIDRVDKRGAVLIALVASAAAVEVAMSFGKSFIFKNRKLLESGVGYGDFLGGLLFLVRGFNTRNKAALDDEDKRAAYENLADGAIDDPLGRSTKDSWQSTTSSTKDSLRATLSSDLVQRPRLSVRYSSLVICDEQAGEMDVPPVLFLDLFDQAWDAKTVVKLTVILVGSAVVGGICGVIGFGAGTIFMLMYILVLRSTTLEGAGTGSLVMALLMFAMLGVYADEINIKEIWVYLVIILPCDLLGAQLASHYAVQLTESKLSFAISLLLFFIGTFMTVLSQVHHKS